MKVDYTLIGQPGDWDIAASAEQRGYDCAWIPEVSHDPFPVLAIAASRTEKIELGTAIAVTFAGSAASIRRAARMDPAGVLRGDA